VCRLVIIVVWTYFHDDSHHSTRNVEECVTDVENLLPSTRHSFSLFRFDKKTDFFEVNIRTNFRRGNLTLITKVRVSFLKKLFVAGRFNARTFVVLFELLIGTKKS
jgi:hypothetical protein